MAIVVMMQVVVMASFVEGKAREMQAPGSLAAASQCSRANPGSVWLFSRVYGLCFEEQAII